MRSGVPERVAIAISGHKSRSMFDRYNITSEDVLRAAQAAIGRRYETSTVWFSVSFRRESPCRARSN